MTCQCQVCTDTRRWEAALHLETPEAKKAFEEIMGRLEAAETDAVYWKLNYQGKWNPEPT